MLDVSVAQALYDAYQFDPSILDEIKIPKDVQATLAQAYPAIRDSLLDLEPLVKLEALVRGIDERIQAMSNDREAALRAIARRFPDKDVATTIEQAKRITRNGMIHRALQAREALLGGVPEIKGDEQ